MIFRNLSSGGVGEIIREAEKLIGEGRYALALEQLNKAREREPKNAYISAIIERVIALSAQASSSAAAPAPGSADASRYLSVTVGPEFETGIKSTDPDEPSSPADREERVRRLTGVAIDLFRHGSYDTAFDSLMKAYLLDPMSRYVIDCERVLAPAIEMMRERAKLTGVPVPREVSPASPEPDNTARPFSPSSEKRLEALLQQKEVERQSHERAIWRDASRAPKSQTMQHGGSPGVPPRGSPPGPDPSTSGGFFSRIKHGKLLD